MKKTLLIISLLFTTAILSAVFTNINFSQASAPSGLQSSFVSMSSTTVGTSSVTTLFATSTNCSSRIISTAEKPIMLTFSDKDGDSPTAIFGHLQSASTTVAYDSGLYGCGAYKAYGHDASSTVQVTETR